MIGSPAFKAVTQHCCGLLALCATAACIDAPTMPAAFLHPAGGRMWVAVSAPADLPDLDTWLAYVDRTSTSGGVMTLQKIESLRDQAEAARRDGALRRALLLEGIATQQAIGAFERMPEPRVLIHGLDALDLWARRATAEVDLEQFPELADAVRRVRFAHAEATQRLAAADTIGAVTLLAQGAAQVREQSPPMVAYRVLERLEGLLRDQSGDDPSVAQSHRMLLGARQALADGDYHRAWKRAMYAMQLAEGRGVDIGAEHALDRLD